MPSKLFQRTSSGSEKTAAFSPPVSLSVHRSTFPVPASSEYTSAGERAEEKVNAEVAALLVPSQAAERSEAEPELRRGPLLARRGVEEAQDVRAVLVGHEGDGPAVGREVEVVDVPVDVRR